MRSCTNFMQKKQSYERIIKSSGMIGGSQAISMLIGLMRTKVVALLVGPSGIGLMSAYQSIVGLFSCVFGLGLKVSAVRELAINMESRDTCLFADNYHTLRRVSFVTGVVGSVVVLLLSKHISMYTFGNVEYQFEVCLIGLGVLATNVSGVYMALLQGMRRIGELAQVNVLSSIAGSAACLVIISFYGVRGIALSVISVSLIQLVVVGFRVRNISVGHTNLSWLESFCNAKSVVLLGLALMWSTLMTSGIAYATRALVARDFDLVSVGLLAAAFSLSALVVNFILGAMASDYYPSLASLSEQPEEMVELVNKQTEIGLIMAMPGLLGVLAFAEIIVNVTYSNAFLPAVVLLRWFSVGSILRVISWPMTFVMMAVGATRLYALTQTLFNLAHILLIWLFLELYGLKGVAVAFLVAYLVQTLLVYYISRCMIGFRWSPEVFRLLFYSLLAVVSVLLLRFIDAEWLQLLLSLVFVGLASICCLCGAVHRLGSDHRLYRLLSKLPGCLWVSRLIN